MDSLWISSTFVSSTVTSSHSDLFKDGQMNQSVNTMRELLGQGSCLLFVEVGGPSKEQQDYVNCSVEKNSDSHRHQSRDGFQ